MSSAEADIIAVIQRYVGCAASMDFAGRKALWDADEPEPILCPEEAGEPLIGWQAMDAYWSRSRVVMADLKAQATGLCIAMLADDLAFATYSNRWIATMAGALPEAPIAADVRMNALLRKKPEGWRYFQLVEGPVDLMTMSRQAAQRNARVLFDGLADGATSAAPLTR
jgi:hypothetical protein